MKISKKHLNKLIKESVNENARLPKNLVETFSDLFTEADDEYRPQERDEEYLTVSSADGPSREDLIDLLAGAVLDAKTEGGWTGTFDEFAMSELIDAMADKGDIDTYDFDQAEIDAEEVMDRVAKLESSESIDPNDLQNDLADMASQIVVSGKKGNLGVNEIISVMLTALQDEMREGFALEEVLQALSKWSASMQKKDLNESSYTRTHFERFAGLSRPGMKILFEGEGDPDTNADDAAELEDMAADMRDDQLGVITSQRMADAKRHAKSDLPRDQADYLGISVEDWYRTRLELDDHYEDRHMEDQMAFDDDPDFDMTDDVETERMRNPEMGEDQPKQMGMGRRPLVGPARDVRRGQRISETNYRLHRLAGILKK